MRLTLAGIARYPVKGLGGETLEAAALCPGAGIPGDRRFALVPAQSPYNLETPRWDKKTNFLQLVNQPRLAQLRARYDGESGALSIFDANGIPTTADPATLLGRREIEHMLNTELSGLAETNGNKSPGIRLAVAPDFAFTDKSSPFVSILSLSTLASLSEEFKFPLELSRFRGNLFVNGSEPWQEFEWLDREITIGTARLRVTERIQRCVATSIHPQTGKRDIEIPQLLREHFGHGDFGVYAQIITTGEIARDCRITLE